MAKESENLQETLKPLYRRALEAEDRLSRLEAVLASKKGRSQDAGNSELQSKLEDANEKLASEQGKVSGLTLENEKQKYRIQRLIQAVRDTDRKL